MAITVRHSSLLTQNSDELYVKRALFQEVLGTILLLTSEVTSEQEIVKKKCCVVMKGKVNKMGKVSITQH